MTIRVFMNVRRGKMDATPVCVYPWEKAILEHIHGQDVDLVSIDQMADVRDGVVKVQLAKLTYSKFHGPNLRQQLEQMAYVSPEEDPAKDPETEYGRLMEKYGMDSEYPIPVVERIYGRIDSGGFKKVLAEFAEDVMKLPSHMKATDEGLGKPVDQLTVAELRVALADRGIEWDVGMKKKELAELLEGALVD